MAFSICETIVLAKIAKERRFTVLISSYFSVDLETGGADPGIARVVSNVYATESTECRQPQTGGQVTVSGKSTVVALNQMR